MAGLDDVIDKHLRGEAPIADVIRVRTYEPILYGTGAGGVRLGENMSAIRGLSTLYDSALGTGSTAERPESLRLYHVEQRVISDASGITLIGAMAYQDRVETIIIEKGYCGYLHDLEGNDLGLGIGQKIDGDRLLELYRRLVPRWLQLGDPRAHIAVKLRDQQHIDSYHIPGLSLYAASDRGRVFRMAITQVPDFKRGISSAVFDLPFVPEQTPAVMRQLAVDTNKGSFSLASSRIAYPQPDRPVAVGRIWHFDGQGGSARLAAIRHVTLSPAGEKTQFSTIVVKPKGERVSEFSLGVIRPIQAHQQHLAGYNIGESFSLRWSSLDVIWEPDRIVTEEADDADSIQIGGENEPQLDLKHLNAVRGLQRFIARSQDLVFYVRLPGFSPEPTALMEDRTYTGEVVGLTTSNQLGAVSILLDDTLHRLTLGSPLPPQLTASSITTFDDLYEGQAIVGDVMPLQIIDRVATIPELGLVLELMADRIVRMGIIAAAPTAL